MNWSWKDLIIENKEGKKTEPEVKQVVVNETVKFPTSNVNPQVISQTSQEKLTVDSLHCQPHLEKILELYDKGFESLNKPGYDFFEFYKAVFSAGIESPAVYPMALNMAKSMDSSVSKEKLVNDAGYYIEEIKKVHSGYIENGNSKKNELIGQKNTEKEQLNVELANLKMQLEAINNQINTAQDKLNNIDNKYANDLNDVDCKLMANDVAKERILTSIEKVKQGLINNVN